MVDPGPNAKSIIAPPANHAPFIILGSSYVADKLWPSSGVTAGSASSIAVILGRLHFIDGVRFILKKY